MNKTEYDDIKANLIKKSLEKNKTDVYVPVERRKRADGRLNFLTFICIVVWAFIFIMIALVTKAGDVFFVINRGWMLLFKLEFWNIEFLKLAFITATICFSICTFGIILNFTRKKRRTDKIKKSLILGEMISSFIIIFFIFLRFCNFY